jgi:hypothetical protein
MILYKFLTHGVFGFENPQGVVRTARENEFWLGPVTAQYLLLVARHVVE